VQEQFAEAETAVRNAWQAYQQAEDVRGMGRALYRMGHIFYNQGEYARTLELVEDAIGSHKMAGDSKGWFKSAMLGTSACLQLKEIDRADAYCRDAEMLAEEINDRVETAVFYFTYADLNRFRGHHQTAFNYAHRALAVFRDMQDIYDQTNALNLLAGNEVFWNDAEPERQVYERGLEYADEGLALAELIDYAVGKGMLLLLKGRLLAQKGDTEEACAAWRQSLEVADAIDHGWLQNRLQELLNENGCPPAHP
jgi:tetratricopeptide (TPR) repeat protein